MNLWIVTIGSSDIQLDSDRANQEKGRSQDKRSNKIWDYWYNDDLKTDHYDISFEPKPTFKDKDEPYRIAARILGEVYQASSQEIQDEIFSYLNFPLLDAFVEELKNHPSPNAIAILLTDQSAIFQTNQRRKEKSPYWQDTCELQPILQKYFVENFPDTLFKFIFLTPSSAAESLDNWDAVLDLVREKFCDLTIADPPIQANLEKIVYVSHQAGTPAISSAVQFCSLSQFGDQVKFLVSNEQDGNLTELIRSSRYLRGLEIQQAVKLLDRRDYAGVMVLLEPYLRPEKSEEIRIRRLLKASIQWNLAKFGDFKQSLIQLEFSQESDFHWYWMGYESAYLAVVRLEQKDVVEALFHSFRACEGLMCNWAEWKYSKHIEYNSKDAPQLKETISKESKKLKEYWEKIAKSNQRWLENSKNKNKSVGLFSANLYKLFQCICLESTENPYIRIVWESAKDERNQQFHRLLGLTETDLYQAWRVTDKLSWQNAILQCLNFITKDDLIKPFKSLESASLMAKVHQELERSIAQL